MCVCACISPFDVVCVPSVVPLQALVHVEQDDHWGDEVDGFPSGQQVKVGATVSTAVTVTEQSERSRNKASFYSSHRLAQRLMFVGKRPKVTYIYELIYAVCFPTLSAYVWFIIFPSVIQFILCTSIATLRFDLFCHPLWTFPFAFPLDRR